LTAFRDSITLDQVELTRAFRAGELSAANYVSQIESHFEKREARVLAFLPEEDRFERLHREAEELITRYPDPTNRPSLFGMTVGVKDIFHADGFVTRAGSQLPAEELRGREAASVTKIKKAGALILGKTFTTEFAYFTPGPTRNPHNAEHTPGGSSSGSAAAVGAGLCPIALGTQTIGSVIRPAAFCGTVGFKPTYERIPRDGVIPLSPSLDHVGFFAPDVPTAKRAAGVLVENLDLGDVDGKPTLGIPEGPYLACASDHARTCFDAICRSLSDRGYELRRIPVMDDYAEVRARHDVIMSADAALVHRNWFPRYESLYSSRFTDLINRGKAVPDIQLQIALEARNNFRTDMAQTMKEKKIDLWICPPTIGPAPKGLEGTGDPIMNLPWTQIGFPAINIPTIKVENGLPMGLQIVGNWNDDEALLAWAEDIEKVVREI